MSLKFVLTIRSVGVSFSNRVSQVKVLWFISTKKPKRELALTKLLIEALTKQGMDPAEVWLGTGHDSNRIPLRIRSRSNNSISNSLIAEAG